MRNDFYVENFWKINYFLLVAYHMGITGIFTQE